MSWMEKLYKTYEACAGQQDGTSTPLLPLYHLVVNAHVEVTISPSGDLLEAKVVAKEPTLIPATVKSATARTNAVVPHGLCDQVQYCASDLKAYGRDNSKFVKGFVEQLKSWCSSAHSHPKAVAVLKYVEKGTLAHDLVAAGVLVLDENGKLASEKPKSDSHQGVMPYLPKKKGTRNKPEGIDQGGAQIRWRVEQPLERERTTWKDNDLINAWITYCASLEQVDGTCMVTGLPAVIAEHHPKNLRYPGDNAKLISSLDKKGFTYLGRFTTAEQACSVGIETSLKAHAALQWLISPERGQAHRNGDQVIVTWAENGTSVPDPLVNTFAFMGLEETEATLSQMYHGDAGQLVGQRFRKRIAGYQADIGNLDNIIVMGLDSATSGRMAITYYRVLNGSELMARVNRWHTAFSWYQHYSKVTKFIGAPSPSDIAEAAYGHDLGDKLKRATVSRLLPCIIDSQAVPRELVDTVVRRASRRLGLKPHEWRKCLGIACALYRGTHGSEQFKLTLDMERDTRDYLYGCLLALAEHIENRALWVGSESRRDTSAEKLMQRFSERPYTTWQRIASNLQPYWSRLKAMRYPFHQAMKRRTSELVEKLGDRFKDDSPLSGEYLLGYHCQWLELNPPKAKEDDADTEGQEVETKEPINS